MQTEADYYALFEAYQRGELAAGARASLEARLSAEPRLHQLYTEYVELTGTLLAYGERRRARHTISALHEAMLAAETTPATEVASPLTYSVNPILRISRTERKLREFWSGHRATVGVAASVAVLAVFSTLLGLNLWRAANTEPSNGYRMLRLEVAQLKQSQRALTRKVAKTSGVPAAPVNNGKFSGTGFALTADGYLVTSSHVIQGADSLLIEGRDHQRYHAETVYTDAKHDLAILRIKDSGFDGFGKLPYTFKGGQADIGERVYTLGYPREDVVYGEGALSARSGFNGDTAFYQVSIPVNPGNSGGPLLDERGNLIGVVSGRQDDAQSAAFATKSSYLVRLVDSLKNRQPVQPYHLPRTNQLTGAARAQQVKRLQDFVFVVKVYE
ncbi:S1C family serine protease [Hymenobacter sp. BRD67]|uniref:S1C family serine protease n=1 Tax=Hymenobacter sp. BRD67 TaxID=2675877 RepID=UPI001563A347|nr:serine protease [Hymenobacter sp. BRD67]QKG54011.1 trypsin-like peptidase domain-containing protein [Hymenobacter sp. BRD67]